MVDHQQPAAPPAGGEVPLGRDDRAVCQAHPSLYMRGLGTAPVLGPWPRTLGSRCRLLGVLDFTKQMAWSLC